MNLWKTCIKANDSLELFITLRKHPSIPNSIILHFHHTFSLQLLALFRIHFIDWLLSIGKNCTESKEMSINYTPGRILHYKTLQRKSTIPTYEQRKHLKFPGRPSKQPGTPQNAWEEIVKRLNVYPRKARSLFAPLVSPPAGSSGTWANSSVGKYEVSVIERR